MKKIEFKGSLYEQIKDFIDNKHNFVLARQIVHIDQQSRVFGSTFQIDIEDRATGRTIKKVYATGGGVCGRKLLLDALLKQEGAEKPLKEMSVPAYSEKPVYRSLSIDSSITMPNLYWLGGMLFVRKNNNTLYIVTDKDKNIIGGDKQCD